MPAAARRRPDVDQHGHVGAAEEFRHPPGRGGPVPERQQHVSAILRRVGTPAAVAAAIVYLAGAGFVTGTVLECAGGANLTVGAVAG